ncbi:bifunctional tRNA (5-methylaminomethyl-2-thiouridine)(34)-methyltransferase MnmD/FAD-dependent 5-carboxymethylaminomethyl-2-thiouridine(34) oxidoreductase MnmC [Crenobacter caeni]|uniref:tRNA 5-methylaminomethyl-2-thiouridine biosynthesis bifunctional protein MnmC n=1 Tax=Crenobacter caeni TaxID=2705474 RepID=A0A6B2KNM6_9NEIS|nr:bifunctional tRNA (5-methylaminomethyl-2-thiouridine)(34)-methyltransferase MnmD/FAD-dependent 5-carboxymethylaminomethyl-2-thiouridine(34) oxidoreductase MnmC [Crenobacter caeni]NDV11764.1 bifunctional tRNA (5-methylaminomethyl-2-thiouridine)(34)-methyltransferase MnmD/FAD-dependent 5-carboxymethylaminomethyl-2-thiouridine(34) oxidoreductase MnmC [Crenobacter caeni]
MQHADLDWEDGQPRSRAFGDVYFSRDSGLDETRHVFLAGNRLPERFAALAAGERLTVAETGFGTGLNFLAAWQLFDAVAPAGARLDFVSTEKYPLSLADLTRALAAWPALSPYADALLAQYRGVVPGYQRFVFDGGRVVLTLLVGDVLETLPQLDARVDAWFLDGFSPAKNPDMWVQALFDAMAACSAAGASFATFTAAGFVRRGLSAAGFDVKKVPGFGSKREMSVGTLPHAPERLWRAPWLARPATITGRRALVIGAGIAGASAAASLARRGFAVTVVERHPLAAQEASGNPQGVLYLKLSAHGTAQTRLLLAAYGYALRTLASSLTRGRDWDDCGVLQLAFDEATAHKQDALAAAFPEALLKRVDAAGASEHAGVALAENALYFPEGGWIKPPALVQALLATPGVTCRYGQAEQALARMEDGWRLTLANGEALDADMVVIACANQSGALLPDTTLPLKPIRGQVSVAPATEQSSRLRTVLCGEAYVAPAADGAHTFGATFDFKSTDTTATLADHRANIDALSALSPALYAALGGDALAPEALGGRAALRSSTPDYLPLVGPLASHTGVSEAYAELARDATLPLTTTMPWLPGLYISAGHGSRGMVSAPLAGELIASLACGETLPLPAPIVDALSPSRFALRALMRRKKT